MNRMRSLVLGSLVALAVTTTACGQGVDRMGNEPAAPVTLRGETSFNSDAVAPYAAEVARATGDALRLDVSQTANLTPEVEADIIERVRSGALDVGFVGTRAWTGYDIHAFDAVHAPLLIDSYALERDVLQRSILDKAGASLEPLGLTSIGILPGPLRLPGSRARALMAPADYVGAHIAITKSQISEATLGALGASTTAIAPGGPLDGLDGMEGQLDAMPLRGPTRIGVVTANVILWPRPVSVIINTARFQALSSEQQAALRAAVGASLDTTIDALRAGEAEALGTACRNGVRFVDATASDLEALRTAVEPVYATLRADAATSAAIDAITALRTGTGDRFSCPDQPVVTASPNAEATPIDGTWKACPTEADIIAAGGLPEEAKGNAGCTTMTFDRGIFREAGASAESGDPGTYSLTGDHQLVINRSNGERFQFTWSLFQDQLSLDLPTDTGAVSPAPNRALPWARQEG